MNGGCLQIDRINRASFSFESRLSITQTVNRNKMKSLLQDGIVEHASVPMPGTWCAMNHNQWRKCVSAGGRAKHPDRIIGDSEKNGFYRFVFVIRADLFIR